MADQYFSKGTHDRTNIAQDSFNPSPKILVFVIYCKSNNYNNTKETEEGEKNDDRQQ
jgi:hypothetical protein